MFIFENTKLTQTQFEKLAQFLTRFKQCCATSKFDVGKIKVELNLPIKAIAIFNKKESYLYSTPITRQSTTLTRHFDTFWYYSTREYRYLHHGKNFRQPCNYPLKRRIPQNRFRCSPVEHDG